MYWAASLASLAFLIVVHEAGHYFVARWCGMRIERFSIGFGPGIIKRRSKDTGTVFQLAPIPFGGFVEIRGMNIAEEVDPEDLAAYPNRPAWQRFLTIFAGPATNYLSAVVIMFALYTCHGTSSPWAWYGVGTVNAGFDAVGKLQDGDRILEVDHEPLLAQGKYTLQNGQTLYEQTLTGRINARHGAPVTLTVLRDGARHDVTIQPRLPFAAYLTSQHVDPQLVDGLSAQLARIRTPLRDYKPFADSLASLGVDPGVVDALSVQLVRLAKAWTRPNYQPFADYVAAQGVDSLRVQGLAAQLARLAMRAQPPPLELPPTYLLGIAPTAQPDVLDASLPEAVVGAIEFPIRQTQIIAGGLYEIITGRQEADPRGPKGIFDEFAKAWKLGPVTGIQLLAMLSVYLGLFNLFPLPALDGGRLVFLLYEMVTRRRANPKIEAMVHMAGIMVLGVVMVLVTLRDFHVFA
jgi:regulator of sigma E protease